MNYTVHKFLEDLSIEHIIADNILDENDEKLVFDKTVSLYDWYNQNDIFQKMEFQGINLLGVLDDTEFHIFMISKLCEIITLQKILKNKSPKKIVAEKQIIELIKTNPKNYTYQNLLSIAYAKQKKISLAIKTLKKIIINNPNFVDAHTNIAAIINEEYKYFEASKL